MSDSAFHPFKPEHNPGHPILRQFCRLTGHQLIGGTGWYECAWCGKRFDDDGLLQAVKVAVGLVIIVEILKMVKTDD